VTSPKRCARFYHQMIEPLGPASGWESEPSVIRQALISSRVYLETNGFESRNL